MTFLCYFLLLSDTEPRSAAHEDPTGLCSLAVEVEGCEKLHLMAVVHLLKALTRPLEGKWEALIASALQWVGGEDCSLTWKESVQVVSY